jgi:hypothetical protein
VAAGTISDVKTSRAWTGAEFKKVAERASKAASHYRPPERAKRVRCHRTICGYRTSNRASFVAPAAGAARMSGLTSTGTSRRPLRWVIDEEKVPPPGQRAEQAK